MNNKFIPTYCYLKLSLYFFPTNKTKISTVDFWERGQLFSFRIKNIYIYKNHADKKSCQLPTLLASGIGDKYFISILTDSHVNAVGQPSFLL